MCPLLSVLGPFILINHLGLSLLAQSVNAGYIPEVLIRIPNNEKVWSLACLLEGPQDQKDSYLRDGCCDFSSTPDNITFKRSAFLFFSPESVHVCLVSGGPASPGMTEATKYADRSRLLCPSLKGQVSTSLRGQLLGEWEGQKIGLQPHSVLTLDEGPCIDLWLYDADHSSSTK